MQGGYIVMKLYRVVNTDSFKTYSKDKVERVTYKDKTYICSRFIDYSKTNVLTLRKQRMVIDMINKGEDLEKISATIGVPLNVISLWLSHYRMGGL